MVICQPPALSPPGLATVPGDNVALGAEDGSQPARHIRTDHRSQSQRLMEEVWSGLW
jgi:hypothetical protein